MKKPENDDYDPVEEFEREIRRDKAIARAYDGGVPDPITPPGVLPVVTREYIEGVPFDRVDGLSDVAKCGLCGDVVDVGGEIRAHIAQHQYE